MTSMQIKQAREENRLAALARYRVLDTPRDRAFDDLAALASEICGTPIAVVNLVGDQRQWFKAEVGLGIDSTPLETSFCRTAILEEDFMLVPDATLDARFACNPLVTVERGLRFYAGALLKSPDGHAIGTLCVLDREPRTLSEQQQRALRRLARQVMDQLELRLALLEREEVNVELRASEARFRSAIDAVQGILWTNNALGEMQGDQPGWSALTGQGVESYAGYGWTEAVHPDDTKATLDAWNEAVAGKHNFVFEHRVCRHDGVWRRYSIRAIPIVDMNGDVSEWVGVHTDVTEQREAECQLRELHDQLEARVASALAERTLFAELVERTDAFVQVIDADFRCLAINRAAAAEFDRIYGVRPKIGDSILDLLADKPEHQRAVYDVWTRALRGEEFTETAEFGEPGRDRRFYEMKFNVLRDDTGGQTGAYQFVHDVTDRVREQAALIAAEEALRQSQKLEAIGQLTGGVAHDFNNLLTVILGSVALLRRGGLSEAKQALYIDAISDTADRAAKLTGQLLAFARRQTLRADLFDVGVSLRDVATMLQTLCGSRVRLEVRLPEEPHYVIADRSQFDTAIVNMGINARDAMNGAGRLDISTRPVIAIPSVPGHAAIPGDYVAVSVSDSGSGITPDQLSRIFEPFFTTKGIGQGTGLGLSQAIGFAKQSGGDIRVDTHLGKGTTFTLYLPRAYPEEPFRPVMAAEPDPVRGPGLRVLLVEDNPDVGRFATAALSELGFDCVLAPDAEAALALLTTDACRFDIVFSDVVMPGMSGLELGGHVRRLYPSLPFVLTSGYSEIVVDEGNHGFELLQKPYSTQELASRLHAAFGLHMGTCAKST